MKPGTAFPTRCLSPQGLAVLGFVVLGFAANLRSIAAEPGSLAGWTDLRLDNGLELIVVEDHATPFARVDLLFKAGAIAQGSGNAGHFHVLEHVLLDGRAGGAPSISAGIEALSPLEWNGETSTESLAFRMKLAATDVEAGLALWARLALTDSFSSDTVDAAKAAAGAEAASQLGDPESIYQGAMTRRLFSKYPWRRDPAGSVATIATATPESLARLKSTWLTPGNAALVIVGDVDPLAVVAAARLAFAPWKAAPSPWKTALPPQPKLGAARPTWFYLSDPTVPEGLVLIEVRYRGPDMATDLQSAVAAELWTEMVRDPAARMGRALVKAVPSLHGQLPYSIQYLSQRDGGLISLTAAIDLEKPGLVLSRARAFKETFRGNEVTAMRNDAGYFPADALERARSGLLGHRLEAIDSVDGRAAEIEFSWASVSGDFFLSYPGKVASIGAKEIDATIDTWILHNLEVVALRLNPADAEREGRALTEGGFESVKASNAFWWQGR